MKEGKIMFKTAFDLNPKDIGFIKTTVDGLGSRVSTAPISATIATTTTASKFYDDDMLDYLLKDLIQERAKEAEQILKEEEAKSAKKYVKYFNNEKIKKVVFNDPATIIFWKNGDKTVVKCQPGEEFDKEKGLALAIVKYMIANNKGCFNDIFKKWIDE